MEKGPYARNGRMISGGYSCWRQAIRWLCESRCKLSQEHGSDENDSPGEFKISQIPFVSFGKSLSNGWMAIPQLFVTELLFGLSTDFFQIWRMLKGKGKAIGLMVIQLQTVAKLPFGRSHSNSSANGTWAIQNAPPLNLPIPKRNMKFSCRLYG